MQPNRPVVDTTSTEDIDLLLLLERSLAFFKKYRMLFIIAFAIGTAWGIYKYLMLPNVYSSRLIAHSSVLTNQEEIQIIANWNNLIKKNEYAEVAADFNCSESILHKVKNIEGTEIQKVFSPTNPNGFYIDVSITDNSILGALQKAIVYGFENGDYVKERLTFKRDRLKEMIDKTTIEILKLDSNKSAVENIIMGKERPSSSLVVDGSSINRQLIDMNEKLLYWQEELNFTNGIQVLQGFSRFDKPTGPKLLVLLVLGWIFCLALAYIYALFNSLNRKLKARSQFRSAK
jgi:hypothetical protein